MRDLEYYREWLEANGKEVLLDGLAYRLKVTTFMAVYPYRREVISVMAEPVNKNSRHYLEVKRDLGDDWSTDVLDSDASLIVDVARQIGIWN